MIDSMIGSLARMGCPPDLIFIHRLMMQRVIARIANPPPMMAKGVNFLSPLTNEMMKKIIATGAGKKPAIANKVDAI